MDGLASLFSSLAKFFNVHRLSSGMCSSPFLTPLFLIRAIALALRVNPESNGSSCGNVNAPILSLLPWLFWWPRVGINGSTMAACRLLSYCTEEYSSGEFSKLHETWSEKSNCVVNTEPILTNMHNIIAS